MRPVFLLLTVAWRALSDGAPASVEHRLSVSPVFFSFQALPSTSGVMPDLLDRRTGTECECRASCMTNPACLGYGYSSATDSCLLSGVLPTPDRLQADADMWLWFARGGVRQLGEPCSADSECHILTPGGACLAGLCSCRAPLQLSEGRCIKSGEFIAVGTGRFSGEAISEISVANVDECKELCAGNLTCMGCDFSAAAGRCLQYAGGITSDVGSGSDALSFLWRFPRPDGTAPDSSRTVGDHQTLLLGSVTGQNAAAACFQHNSILYPGLSQQQLTDLQTVWPELFDGSSGGAFFGAEDMLVEGSFVRSDGHDAPTIAWSQHEPNNYGGEDCAAFGGAGPFVNDVPCDVQSQAFCQYVGDNLALRKLGWMNMALPSSPASRGNDGDVSSAVTVPLAGVSSLTWTADLGGPVQVTSVLYVASDSGADYRNTEIRVGSDRVAFDGQHSARCVLLTEPFVASGYARLFRCDVPVTGRYVRLIRHSPGSVLDFAELAVFGNRLETVEGGCPACA